MEEGIDVDKEEDNGEGRGKGKRATEAQRRAIWCE